VWLFFCCIMSYDKVDSFHIRFTGKNYLSKVSYCGVILMGVLSYLKRSRLCLNGKSRMLRLWLGSLTQLSLTLFSIWGFIQLSLTCEIIWIRFTIKTTRLNVFNWSMRWLISHKEVSPLRNSFLVFKIFGLIIPILFKLMSSLQLKRSRQGQIRILM